MTFFISWTYAENSTDEDQNWVKVEKDVVIIEDKDGRANAKFVSFKDRRDSWGFRLALFGGSNMLEFKSATTEPMVKHKSESVDFGFQIMTSYNFPLVSIGVGGNFEYLKFKQDIKAMKYGADVHAVLDGFMPDPYVAPYVKLGIGQMSFGNSIIDDVEKFETKLAIYYSVGALFLLDWLQKTMAMDAFYNYGVEGSFLFVEYEMYPKLQSANQLVSGEFKLGSIKSGIQIVF